MTRLFLIFLMATVIAACDYEISPWTTDVYCPGLEINSNIERLKRIESMSMSKTNFKFAVIGDPQQYPKDLDDTIDVINDFVDVDFILLLGDIAETGIAQEFEWACKALSKAQMPVIAVIGNHDALSFGKQIWANAFGPEDYSFTYFGTKFVAFNNNRYEYPDAPNVSFLEAEAAVSADESRNLTIGLSHIQPWPDQHEFSAQLKSYGYDYMFHAHEHKFSYWQKQNVGLPHFIVADTRFVKYAIVSVSESALSIKQCEPVCFDSDLKVKP